jgi:hypothetical protein
MTQTDQGLTRARRPGTAENRVDPAHGQPRGAEERAIAEGLLLEQRSALGGLMADHVADPAALFVAQVQNHASQLAEQLQIRQENLDRREAEIHARQAAVENQARSARLWVDQRQEELDERDRQIDARGALINRRLAEWGLAWESGAEPHEVETHLTRRAAELKDREERLQQWHDRLEKLERETEQKAAQLDVRKRSLEKSEQLLQSEQVALSEARRQLEFELTRVEEQRVKHEEELLVDRERCDRDEQRRRQSLDQRAEDLDKREARLEQLQDVLAEGQREALELRLATEEIWSELSNRVDAVQLDRRVTQIRARLSDHYSLARSELVERQDELRRLAAEIITQHERLQLKQDEFAHWIERRKSELEQQAARLASRERDLQQRQSKWDEQCREWAAERMEYQQEIRRLTLRMEPLDETDISLHRGSAQNVRAG